MSRADVPGDRQPAPPEREIGYDDAEIPVRARAAFAGPRRRSRCVGTGGETSRSTTISVRQSTDPYARWRSSASSCSISFRDILREPRSDHQAEQDRGLAPRRSRGRFSPHLLLLRPLQASCSSTSKVQLVAVERRRRTRLPGSRAPERTMRESSFSTSRWIVRRSGRAPNSGSKPSRASSSTASSVNSTSIRCARSLRASRSSSSRVISTSCSPVRDAEDDDLVDPVDELRPEALPQDLHQVLLQLLERLLLARVLAGCGRRRGSRS